jgi:hypothetical protein
MQKHFEGERTMELKIVNADPSTRIEGERSEYVAISNARWDESLPRLLWRQLSKKSFRN